MEQRQTNVALTSENLQSLSMFLRVHVCVVNFPVRLARIMLRPVLTCNHCRRVGFKGAQVLLLVASAAVRASARL